MRLEVAFVASVRAAVAAVLTAASLSVAAAQMPPGDTGRGVQRGMQALNNSGEVGTVTLFPHGSQTRVVISLHGQPAGRSEPALIMRVASCTGSLHAATIPLEPVVGESSRTVVDFPADRLLSGNYSVLVHAQDTKPMHFVSCGQLYR